LLDQFQTVMKPYLQQAQGPLLVAVSGGLDSVVLARLCQQAGYSLVLAHMNFGLRGDESFRDQQFVEELGNVLEAEVVVKSVDANAYATAEGLSIQEAARNLRYQWFDALCRERGCSFVLTAHHADDNVETVLLHLFRGTGLNGLSGMQEYTSSQKLLRPLLSFRRAAIESYAREQGWAWVEDSSNAGTAYTRNFLRHEVLPLIRKAFPQVDKTLLDTASRFQKIRAVYQATLDEWEKKMVERKGAERWIPVRKLHPERDESLFFHLLYPYGFSERQVREAWKLCRAPGGRYLETEGWQLIRHRNWLVLAPRVPEASTVAIEVPEGAVHFQNGRLELALVSWPGEIDPSASVACLDAQALQFPLLLRRWKPGDYFYPFGMRKKKKLARFLIDLKLNKHQKENVWVLQSGERIAWVVGLRIDDRFKTTPATTSMLSIRFIQSADQGSHSPAQ
jgi:tRNA(Ile)-lysidine synthase